MKNLHLLPTEKPSRLYKSKITQNIFICNIISQYGDATYNQHIYITSDEKIKEGVNQWYLDKFLNKPYNSGGSQYSSKQNVIILTTDPELIADGVQAIDDEFLNWFVKNPTCEYVEVKHFGTCCGNQSITQCINCEKYNPIYKITIPKEEPKQETLENSKLALREYILANKEKVTEDLQEMREKSGTGRDETLEEAADNYSENWEEITGLDYEDCVPFSINKLDFIAGAKWQSERMYSEEDMGKAYFSGISSTGEGWNGEYADGNDPNIEEKFSEGFTQWFEQFKKK
jgi:hypothetical protein